MLSLFFGQKKMINSCTWDIFIAPIAQRKYSTINLRSRGKEMEAIEVAENG